MEHETFTLKVKEVPLDWGHQRSPILRLHICYSKFPEQVIQRWHFLVDMTVLNKKMEFVEPALLEVM